MTIPHADSELPELMTFAQSLGNDYQAGTLNSWQKMKDRVLAFYTPARMDAIETVIPGWRKMASYSDGAVLGHVTAALTALLLNDEYQHLPPDGQTLLKWIVLFHDLEKEPQYPKRDLTHGFRSAATTGRVLPQLGFPMGADRDDELKAWASLTSEAITYDPTLDDNIQDNGKLPGLIDGIEHNFGVNTPVALVIKTVLLHMSINVLDEWPQAAPLTDAEIRRYIDAPLFPLLRVMMLVDNDAYAFFDPPTKARHRAEALAAFKRAAALCGISQASLTG